MAQADCIHLHLWHQHQSQLRPVLPWNYPYPYTAFYRASENLSPQHMTEHISQYCHSILHTMLHPHNRIWQESSHSTQPHTVDHQPSFSDRKESCQVPVCNQPQPHLQFPLSQFLSPDPSRHSSLYILPDSSYRLALCIS